MKTNKINYFSMKILAISLAVFLSSCCSNKTINNIDILIPEPNESSQTEGTFNFTKNTSISISDAELKNAKDYLSQILSTSTNNQAEKTAEAENTNQDDADISLIMTNEGKAGSYILNVAKDKITISGHGYNGVINGINTLRQLLPIESENGALDSFKIQCVNIKDQPRYSWRGLELDVSRHFFTKTEVEELIDLMALYKMNKLHMHLTDDQGWRVEIKKYPLLTEKGAFRHFNNHDKGCMNIAKSKDNTDMLIPEDKLIVKDNLTTEKSDTFYGGYYTQDDIRELVQYAGVRGIEIIPEIDMPGHMLAAVSNYKGLACTDNTGWGQVFSSPLCPGKDKAIEFCKNIYSEIFELFPSEYVHIGGDEVEKINWKKCPDCQKRMRRNGLKNEAQLQAWFNHQMEYFFNAHGKKMIGWDEIEEGGLSETSTVMWWRSWAKGMNEIVTGQGNDIIYTPNSAFYLDYEQDCHSVKKIFDFNPDEGLSDEQRSHILGVQGNIWTEWIPSRERLFYMAAPRMLAIAELGWSAAEDKDWNSFEKRMVSQFRRLDEMGITYRIPDIDGYYSSNAFIDETELHLSCIDPTVQIRYTTDGSIPTIDSPLYKDGMKVTENTSFTFRTFSKDGRAGDFVKAEYIRDEFADALSTKELEENLKNSSRKSLEKGLNAKWYLYGGEHCSEIESAPLKGSFITDGINIPKEAKGKIGLIFSGYINIPADDIYTFFLKSDDGSLFSINGITVVDNDGPHAPRLKIGQKALRKGYHKVHAKYFDHNGGMLNMVVKDSKGNIISNDGLFLN